MSQEVSQSERERIRRWEMWWCSDRRAKRGRVPRMSERSIGLLLNHWRNSRAQKKSERDREKKGREREDFSPSHRLFRILSSFNVLGICNLSIFCHLFYICYLAFCPFVFDCVILEYYSAIIFFFFFCIFDFIFHAL